MDTDGNTATIKRRYAVTSPSGMHIGLWDDCDVAMAATADTEGRSMEALVPSSDYDALAAKLAEVEGVLDICSKSWGECNKALEAAEATEAMLPISYNLSRQDIAKIVDPNDAALVNALPTPTADELMARIAQEKADD